MDRITTVREVAVSLEDQNSEVEKRRELDPLFLSGLAKLAEYASSDECEASILEKSVLDFFLRDRSETLDTEERPRDMRFLDRSIRNVSALHRSIVHLMPERLQQELELSESLNYPRSLIELLKKYGDLTTGESDGDAQLRAKEKRQIEVLMALLPHYIEQHINRDPDEEYLLMGEVTSFLENYFRSNGPTKKIRIVSTIVDRKCVKYRWEEISEWAEFGEKDIVVNYDARRLGPPVPQDAGIDDLWCIFSSRIKTDFAATMKYFDGRDPSKDNLAVRVVVPRFSLIDKFIDDIHERLPENWVLKADQDDSNRHSMKKDLKYFLVEKSSGMHVEIQFEWLTDESWVRGNHIPRAFGEAHRERYAIKRLMPYLETFFPQAVHEYNWDDPSIREELLNDADRRNMAKIQGTNFS